MACPRGSSLLPRSRGSCGGRVARGRGVRRVRLARARGAALARHSCARRAGVGRAGIGGAGVGRGCVLVDLRHLTHLVALRADDTRPLQPQPRGPLGS
eukprot:scaffold20021_cov60-Phaeocystis_antarctica.AAC.1